MANWPQGVPAPALDGYGYEPNDITKRTEMTAGLPRVRRVSVSRFGKITFTFKCTEEQSSLFDAWFYAVDGANGGAAWFEMNVKLPAGTSTRMCRFVGPPKSNPISHNRWQFNGVVEVTYA